MTQSYHHPSDVLTFGCQAMEGGQDITLVILTSVTGGAMRATGAMMCVTGDGQIAGYVSNGCVDADIGFQAVTAIHDGQVRHLVYGEGSPFKDIDLPCGGRIELVILPKPNEQVVRDLHNRLHARKSAYFLCSGQGRISLGEAPAREDFSYLYRPKLKLRIVGRGDAILALAGQSQQSGFDVHVQSPDAELESALAGVKFDHLTNPAKVPDVTDDTWTAVVVMFHDHAWEPDILKQALAGPAFYIGAMGSPRTHANRISMLKEADVDAEEITRVRGPIGLIPSMRDANLLALSTLAEIVSVAQEAGCL